MPKGKKLTDFEKLRIIHCYDQRTSPSLIAAILGHPTSTITSFYSKWVLNCELSPKLKLPKAWIPPYMGIQIKRLAQDTKNIGTRRMVQMLRKVVPEEPWYPSRSTVRRYLKKSGFDYKTHKLKPLLTDFHKNARLNFAQKWLETINGIPKSKLGVVIWSDETAVRARPYTRKFASWIPKNEPVPFKEAAIAGKFSVMFWGCLSTEGRGPLIAIPKKTTIDAAAYLQTLKNYLLPEATWLVEHGVTVKVMHDGAPGHKAQIIKDYIEKSEIEFIDWPANSPDLNPIENIWAWMKMILYSEYPLPNNEKELTDYFFEIWERIDIELIQKFCLNYERRLIAVIDNDGGHTKY